MIAENLDRYNGYNDTCSGRRARVACSIHACRQFWDALSSSQERAADAHGEIGELCRVAHKAVTVGVLGTALHLAKRRALSKPLVDDLVAWARQQ